MQGIRFRSFKLRYTDGHVRAVVATDAEGCPFSGPGVDLRGDEASAIFAAAAPLLRLLAEVEPGIEVQSMAVDLERPRVTATLETTEARPRVVRIDGGALLERLIAKADGVLAALAVPVGEALARRG